MCGKYVTQLYYHHYCKDCSREINRGIATRKRMKAVTKYDAMYNDWLAKVQEVPKSYPTITESQWLEACSYFNGCALCDTDQIDTRFYFIKFDKGGRYCDWNVLPVCDRCAVSVKGLKNPFRPLTDGNLYAVPRLDKIVSYLEPRLNKALKWEQRNDE